MSAPDRRPDSSPAKAVNLRVRAETRALIDRAARAQGRSRSDFMIEASRRAAEDAILDQTVILMDPAGFEAFRAALDAPPTPNDRLLKTMRTPAPWDEA